MLHVSSALFFSEVAQTDWANACTQLVISVAAVNGLELLSFKHYWADQ